MIIHSVSKNPKHGSSLIILEDKGLLSLGLPGVMYQQHLTQLAVAAGREMTSDVLRKILIPVMPATMKNAAWMGNPTLIPWSWVLGTVSF